MTEDERDDAYIAREKFLKKVREAFREMKRELNKEQLDFIIYPCQDALSLFSPWMSSDE